MATRRRKPDQVHQEMEHAGVHEGRRQQAPPLAVRRARSEVAERLNVELRSLARQALGVSVAKARRRRKGAA